MEKPARAPDKRDPRPVLQPPLHERSAPLSTKDIRRQLGWGLVEAMHKGAPR